MDIFWQVNNPDGYDNESPCEYNKVLIIENIVLKGERGFMFAILWHTDYSILSCP